MAATAGPVEQPARLGAAIRFLRLSKGISSAKVLSRKAGLSESYVSKIENGECVPSVRAFGAIALALGMTPMQVWAVVMCEGRQTFLSQGSVMLGANR
jgi:predicted transcriptional regulator